MGKTKDVNKKSTVAEPADEENIESSSTTQEGLQDGEANPPPHEAASLAKVLE